MRFFSLHLTGVFNPFHPSMKVSFLILKIDFSALSPQWMELPHLSFEGKAKLSNQLTQGFIRKGYI